MTFIPEKVVLTKGELARIKKLESLMNKHGPRRMAHGIDISSYIKKHANVYKMSKGKPRRWDTRTGTWYSQSRASEYVYKEKFGTKTPVEDLRYLKAKQLQLRREAGVQYNDPVRIKASKKLVIDDKNPYGSVYELEQSKRLERDRAELWKLRKKTSFHRLDKEAREDASEAGKIERERQEWGPEGEPKAKLKVGETYEKLYSDVKDKDINKSPASVAKVNEIEKNTKPLRSDVFTLDKDGNPLGVMTRSQRRVWDAANQNLMIARKQGTNNPNIPKSRLAIATRNWDNWSGEG